MGLWGVGRAFSDRSFLKILIFSTDNGRFSAGGALLPPPIGNRVKELIDPPGSYLHSRLLSFDHFSTPDLLRIPSVYLAGESNLSNTKWIWEHNCCEFTRLFLQKHTLYECWGSEWRGRGKGRVSHFLIHSNLLFNISITFSFLNCSIHLIPFFENLPPDLILSAFPKN